MKFAIFGTDDLTEKLAQDIASSQDHHLVWWLPTTGFIGQDPPWIGPQTVVARKEDPLASLSVADVDAVVISRQQDAAAMLEIIRQLAACSEILLLSHPVDLSVLASFELERVQQDSVARMIPLRPNRWHPGAVYFARYVCGDPEATPEVPGSVERIEMERRINDTDLETVQVAFARDIDLVQSFTGKLLEVSGMAAGEKCLPLNVQLSGESGVLARWSAVRTEDATSESSPLGAELKVFGSRTASLSMSEGIWQVETPEGMLAFEPPSLADACAGQVESDRKSRAVRGDWPEVTHSLEVTEAMTKSLQRGKRVQLNLEGRGESTAFKGTMVSLGCALLMGGVVLLVVSAIILKLAQANGLTRFATMFEKVPAALAVVLVLFLFLQCLRFLIPASSKPDSGE